MPKVFVVYTQKPLIAVKFGLKKTKINFPKPFVLIQIRQLQQAWHE